MRSIKFKTQSEALALNERITSDGLRTGAFTSGTSNYCNPEFDTEINLWSVPILEGYEHLFTAAELDLAHKQSELQPVLMDMAICQNALLVYLSDNKQLNLTNGQIMAQLEKFKTIKALLEVGSRGLAKQMIQGVEVDEVFTQQRKDKYVSML